MMLVVQATYYDNYGEWMNEWMNVRDLSDAVTVKLVQGHCTMRYQAKNQQWHVHIKHKLRETKNFAFSELVY